MTTGRIFPGWISKNLPASIKPLNSVESNTYLKRFDTLTEELCQNGISRRWPNSKQLRTVASQDGFDLTNQNAKNIEGFIGRYSQSGVVFWATNNLEAGVFASGYNVTLRNWLSSEFILSPVSMIASDAEIIIIIDEQLSFT